RCTTQGKRRGSSITSCRTSKVNRCATGSSGRVNCRSRRHCGSRARWRAPLLTPTATTWCTGTSSRRTSCCPVGKRWWRISGSRGRLRRPGAGGSPRRGFRWEHRRTWVPRGGPMDGRSDVYSLACVLYEMLAGEPPYTGPSAQVVIAKRFTDPVPSVRRLRETIPPAVDTAITRALAKAPVDRYATATNFGEALTAATPTPTMTARAWRGVLIGATGAVLVIVA